jgi:hypothetical protein
MAHTDRICETFYGKSVECNSSEEELRFRKSMKLMIIRGDKADAQCSVCMETNLCVQKRLAGIFCQLHEVSGDQIQ